MEPRTGPFIGEHLINIEFALPYKKVKTGNKKEPASQSEDSAPQS